MGSFVELALEASLFWGEKVSATRNQCPDYRRSKRTNKGTSDLAKLSQAEGARDLQSSVPPQGTGAA